MFNLLHNKTVLTLVVLLVLGGLIGALHNRALETGNSLGLQDAIRACLSPGNRVLHALMVLGGDGARAARPRYALLKENSQLKKQVQRLERENVILREAAAENTRLRAAVKFRQSTKLEMTPAEIISRNQSSWFDTATIDRGSKSGIVKGAAIVDYRGRLVGQVLEVDTYTSQIVSITDPNSAIAGMVQRSRHSGILQGQGADYPLLSYLPKDADVRESDIVISAGIGKVVPKGFVMGRVVKVVRNSTAGTTAAVIRPSVEFDQVEQVFVVKPGQSVEQ